MKSEVAMEKSYMLHVFITSRQPSTLYVLLRWFSGDRVNR